MANEGERKMKEREKYILSTHGPLSQFAVRNGYIPSQKNAKPTPLGVEVLTHTRYPLDLTYPREGL
jgi:hypothetical protein